jgi:two-component system response regulator WspF
MDLVMPVMDGVKATKIIMKNTPCAILIVTASVGANASQVFEAMGFGALDVIKTPSMMQKGHWQGGADIKKKIEIIERYLGMSSISSIDKKPTKPALFVKVPPLLIIGASTGGPMAIAKLLHKIPKETPLAIVIIQHVDQQFAAGLAEWLGKQTVLNVRLALEGVMPTAGQVLIAGFDKHLVVRENLVLHYQNEPLTMPYRPSVDVFFQSVANYWPEASIAVLLTGMGRDGARGLKMLRDKGWYTIAQSQESCVVFGMPKSAIELGGASEILPLSQIAETIQKHTTQPISRTDHGK